VFQKPAEWLRATRLSRHCAESRGTTTELTYVKLGAQPMITMADVASHTKGVPLGLGAACFNLTSNFVSC
jgi:hypothetical protein